MLPKKNKDTRISTFQSVKHRKTEYQVGDCVFLQQPDDEPEPFIAKITKIWCDKKRLKDASKAAAPNKLTVQWYYRPEDTEHKRKTFHGRNELYTSNHSDDVDVHSLLGKCRVHSLKEFLELSAVDCEVDFYTRFTYNPRTMTVDDEAVPVYCLCNMPFNPDLVMIQCTTCEEWYHLDCVGLSEDQANKMAWSYTCTACGTLQGSSNDKPSTTMT